MYTRDRRMNADYIDDISVAMDKVPPCLLCVASGCSSTSSVACARPFNGADGVQQSASDGLWPLCMYTESILKLGGMEQLPLFITVLVWNFLLKTAAPCRVAVRCMLGSCSVCCLPTSAMHCHGTA